MEAIGVFLKKKNNGAGGTCLPRARDIKTKHSPDHVGEKDDIPKRQTVVRSASAPALTASGAHTRHQGLSAPQS
jgi:hypothetical protein